MPESTPPPDHPESRAPRPATVLELMGAVFWSFFGVRKGEAMRRDAVTIKPYQVIIVGIVFAAILVATLIVLVRIITRGT
jgi:hypothetical protein